MLSSLAIVFKCARERGFDEVAEVEGSAQALLSCMSTARVYLAEVFHPWVRWQWPESGFESSSGGASDAGAGGGVWKFRIFQTQCFFFFCGNLKKLDPDKSGTFQNPMLYCGIIKKDLTIFKNMMFPKFQDPSIQDELILS